MQNGFTWFWRASEWTPWELPNTTDYMYASYHVGSGSRRDPGVYEPTSFGKFIACGDSPSFFLESGENVECREYFQSWGCSDEMHTNYSYGNCSGSCGVCTYYCYDIDVQGQQNTHDYGCEIYNEMPILCDIAESYDDEDFTAGFHCCACGGGSRNVCEPDDHVFVLPSDDPTHPSGMNAYVVALDNEDGKDEIVVEFPHATGSQRHSIPRSQVQKFNGRPCHYYSHTVFQAGWGG